MVVAFVYMLIQVLCVIDFSYKWNDSWTSDREQAYLLATVIFSVSFILISCSITIHEYVSVQYVSYCVSGGSVGVN
jgi:hypothetical protein